jgi:GTPase SAR1 family protein
MKVILCGPSHSGKSCLREGLKQALMPMHRAGKIPYPYFMTACPDGEGSWYAETVCNNPELAKQLKQEYKAKFTWRFAQNKARHVQNASLPLTLIDVGGVIDEKNWLIMRHATHAVILSWEMKKMMEWVNFCNELKLQIIAMIQSDYDGICDRITEESPILRGSIHHLERGEDVSSRPMVQALAQILVRLSIG